MRRAEVSCILASSNLMVRLEYVYGVSSAVCAR